MREETIWTVLHKAWGSGSKSGRLMRQLQMQVSGQQLWAMEKGELEQQFPQVPEALWERYFSQRKQTDLNRVEAYLDHNKIHVLLFSNPSYPALLKEIYQPPALLYYKGNFTPADLNIAIVGSRKADHYGLNVAEQLGSQLSCAQVCIVSGLARGIDAKAHQGALDGIAGTIAVQGCGMDQIYPRDNKKLAEQILAHEKGCILSEFPLGSSPEPWHFPQRNRIISGLCQGVVIVQATVKSGACITVESALEQGRDVFAVPGQIQNPLSAGPHRFLQEGARLVTCGTDILEEYGRGTLMVSEKETTNTENGSPCLPNLSKEEEQVLQVITAEPITIEEIAYLSKLSIAELMPILSMLELYDCIQQMIGRKYIRVG